MTKTALIDVGHGANTFPPSKGVVKNGRGYAEYDFNIRLARQLASILEANGVDVTVYPNDGRDVPLRDRTNFYNRQNFDVVISIHANANGDPNVNGRCVFYWHTDSNGKQLAERIAKEFRDAGYSTHGSGLHEGRRGQWTNLHMIREPRTTRVLVEHGFMTGNLDFDLIFGRKQTEYVRDMAVADAKAILGYLGMSYNGTGQGTTINDNRKVDVVVSNDNLYRVQVGAFGDRANAERLAKELRDKGYPVYIPNSDEVTVSASQNDPKPEKSIDDLAKEVLDGKHGNGDARRASLGSNYSAVQRRVNELARQANRKSVDELAREVLNGDWGNNPARSRRLREAGYDASAVQRRVNELAR